MSTDTSALEIRVASKNDAEALSCFWKKLTHSSPYLTFESDEVPELMQLTRTLDSTSRDVILLADQAKKVVGYIGIRVSALRRVSGVGSIAMGVLSANRRAGIGSKLLTEAKRISLDRGLHRLELRVDQDNSEAISLYKRHGFSVEGHARMAALVNGRYVDKIYMATLLVTR